MKEYELAYPIERQDKSQGDRPLKAVRVRPPTFGDLKVANKVGGDENLAAAVLVERCAGLTEVEVERLAIPDFERILEIVQELRQDPRKPAPAPKATP